MVDLEQQRIRGEDAKALLENRLLKDAFERVGSYIEQKALSCDAGDKDRAALILTSKQILAGIKREIERVVEDGEIAKIQIDQLEKRSILRRIAR